MSSLCRLHTSTSHADNLVISYHTGGRKESSTTVDQTLCHQVQSSMLDFDLVVLRPNNTNSNREARIFIFNVREETSLEVICTARQRDGLRMVPVSNNTLMIEFILSELSCLLDSQAFLFDEGMRLFFFHLFFSPLQEIRLVII